MWGEYVIIGRVRAWDGLVALLRVPTASLHQHTHPQGQGNGANGGGRGAEGLGKWIFHGYMHGDNLVGRWRATGTPPAWVGIECAFVLTKDE